MRASHQSNSRCWRRARWRRSVPALRAPATCRAAARRAATSTGGTPRGGSAGAAGGRAASTSGTALHTRRRPVRTGSTEIDDPLARRAARQVHAVHPRLQDVGVGPTVRVGRQAEPFARQIARNVERAALRIAHERGAGVRRQAPDTSEVDAGAAAARRQIGEDLVHGPAVEPRRPPTRRRRPARRIGLVAAGREADHRHPHRRPVDHPRFVAPRLEDPPAADRRLQRPPVRAAADRTGRDESCPDRPSQGELPPRLREPVADQVGFRWHPAGVGRERPRHVVLAQMRDQQLAAQERRVADHDVGRPATPGSAPSGARIASRHSMAWSGFRTGSRASAKPLRRIHWISPIQTETRASSAA